jgi:BTB/POZ domain
MGSSLPQSLDVPDADLILRSADLVNFRVHKSLLSLASPFFKDMLSLPQPPDGEVVDGLPVVRLSEDAELLKYLIPMLYPVSPVLPGSEGEVLSLLATCQKYDMVSVQSLIRAEVRRRPSNRFRAEAFSTYAIASSKRLMLETETAAHLTLGCPMTFDTIGEGLRLFEGWALRDLVRFRKRCRDNVVACLESFLEVRAGPSKIWVGCPDEMHHSPDVPVVTTESTKDVLPRWLCKIFERNKDKIQHEVTHPLDLPSNIRKEFSTALQTHADCHFCWLVHLSDEGSKFCDTLSSELYQACHKVQNPFLRIFYRPENDTHHVLGICEECPSLRVVHEAPNHAMNPVVIS